MTNSQNETLIRIPNALIDRAEVQAFIHFLEDNGHAKTLSKGVKTRDQFEQLFKQWKSETALFSSATAITTHPAYQKMIKMGELVLPFMLIKLQQDPQHLFYALFQITGENPVPYAHAGNLEKMTADWVNWGIQKGYLQ